jgi:GH15 family glucan-1,4-alpha-glucosidase
VALHRAIRLAEEGHIPGGSVSRWRGETEAIRAFIETRCWSEDERSYVRSAGDEDLDAALLLGVSFGYEARDPERLRRTVDAIRRKLADGPFVRRYSGSDGLAGTEGAFLACSFWLVDALARTGGQDEAEELMGELLGVANDVGLYAEEIDPKTGEFLGNFPQALTHLALVNAAATLSGARGR